MRAFPAAAFAILALAAAFAAQAQPPEVGGTLQKIRDQGAIHLGYSEAALPFSYVDGQMTVRGYTWDLCAQVVVAVKDTLGLAALPVVPVPVTNSNRLLLLQTGAIDLECGATASTPSRQRQVAFTHTTFVVGTKVLVRADSPIRSLADLAGKRLVTTLGSGAERHVKTAVALRGVSIDFVQGANHADSLQWLATGKVDAFVLDEPRLAALRAAAPDPAAYRLLDENLAIEPLAIALRKDDPAFKQVVDGAIGRLMKSGEVERLYNQWFLAPLPGSGLNLNLPMSGMLKELLRNPGDRAG